MPTYLKLIVLLFVASLISSCSDWRTKYHATCYDYGTLIYEGDVYAGGGDWNEIETGKRVVANKSNCVFVEIK